MKVKKSEIFGCMQNLGTHFLFNRAYMTLFEVEITRLIVRLLGVQVELENISLLHNLDYPNPESSGINKVTGTCKNRKILVPCLSKF